MNTDKFKHKEITDIIPKEKYQRKSAAEKLQ
jgi:hypothetical protein